MEGDKSTDNDKELTSTSSSDMGKLLSTNDEKSDPNDTTPTSSTDASTSIKSSHLVSDDPISSTSSEMDLAKSKTNEKSSTEKSGKASTFDTEVELLDMSMSQQPTEQITENVDDLVNDLETLLGESADTFNLSFKAKDDSTVEKTEELETEAAAAEEEINDIHGEQVLPENEVSSNTDASTEKIENFEEPNASKIRYETPEPLNTDNREEKVAIEEVVTDAANKNNMDGGDQHDNDVQLLTAIDPTLAEGKSQEFGTKDDAKQDEEFETKDEAKQDEASSEEIGVKTSLEDQEQEGTKADGIQSVKDGSVKVEESAEEVTKEDGENIQIHQEDVMQTSDTICDKNTVDMNSGIDVPVEEVTNESFDKIMDIPQEVVMTVPVSEKTNDIVSSEIKSADKEIIKDTKKIEMSQQENQTEEILAEKEEERITEDLAEKDANTSQSDNGALIESVLKNDGNKNEQICEGDSSDQVDKIIVLQEEVVGSEDLDEQKKEGDTLEDVEEPNDGLKEKCVNENTGSRTEEGEEPENLKEKPNCLKDYKSFSTEEVKDSEEVKEKLEWVKDKSAETEDEYVVQEVSQTSEDAAGNKDMEESRDIEMENDAKTETAEKSNKLKKPLDKSCITEEAKEFEKVKEKLACVKDEGPNTEKCEKVKEKLEETLVKDVAQEVSQSSKDTSSKKVIEESRHVEMEDDAKTDRAEENIKPEKTISEVLCQENDNDKMEADSNVHQEVPESSQIEEFVEDVEGKKKAIENLVKQESEEPLKSGEVLPIVEEPPGSKENLDTLDEGFSTETQEQDNKETSGVDKNEPVADVSESQIEDKNSFKDTGSTSSQDLQLPKESLEVYMEDTEVKVTEKLEMSEQLTEETMTVTVERKATFNKEGKMSEQSTEEANKIYIEKVKITEEVHISEQPCEESIKISVKETETKTAEYVNILKQSTEETVYKTVEKCKITKEIEICEHPTDEIINKISVEGTDTSISEDETVYKTVEKCKITKEIEICEHPTDEIINKISVEGTDTSISEDVEISELPNTSELVENADLTETQPIVEEPAETSKPTEETEEREKDDGIVEVSEEVARGIPKDKEDVPIITEEEEKMVVEEPGIEESKEFTEDTHQVEEKHTEVFQEEASRQNLDVQEVEEHVAGSTSGNNEDMAELQKQAGNAAKTEEVGVKDEVKSSEIIEVTPLEVKPSEIIEEANPLEVRPSEVIEDVKPPVIPSEVIEVKPSEVIPVEVIEEVKPLDKESSRRNKVEKDLQKVVCLSEESSSEDEIGPILKSSTKSAQDLHSKYVPLIPDHSVMPESSTITEGKEQSSGLVLHDIPLAQDLPHIQEENDLIQIAKEVEELEDTQENQPLVSEIPEIPAEGSMPDIEDILADPSPEISSGLQLDTQESLETILAVAALQNEPVQEVKQRKLSEKELRDMEAIRMAVASITDGSQDSYQEEIDSYLVESNLHVQDHLVESRIEDVLPKDVVKQVVTEDLKNQGIPKESKEIVSQQPSSVIEAPPQAVKVHEEPLINDKDLSIVANDLPKDPEIPIQEPLPSKDSSTTTEATEISSEPKNSALDESSLSSKSVSEGTAASEQGVVEEKPAKNRGKRGNKVIEPLSIRVEEPEQRERVYSPKVIIKPVRVPDEEVSTTSETEVNKGCLKMTITKQSDKLHSILKVYNPEEDLESNANQEEPIPKLIIKPKMQQVEQQHSPKMSTRSSKQVYSPTSTSQRCSSPRVTIKPVIKPEPKSDAVSPLKITFKPVVNPDEAIKRHSPKTTIKGEQDQKNHNPKITIKPIPKPATESDKDITPTSTPKVTIKPIKRQVELEDSEVEQEKTSPKITIKPVVKPNDVDVEPNQMTTPRLIIKPIKKQEEVENDLGQQDRSSPKISIKPIVKPTEMVDEDVEGVKERIVLKINKGNLPTPSKESKKREYPDDDKSEKLAKIKLKFSTSGGHPHIVQLGEESNKRQRKDSGYSGNPAKRDLEECSNKRPLEERMPERNKKLRSSGNPTDGHEESNEEARSLDPKINSPIVISEDSRSQHSADCILIDNSPDSSDISKIAEIASRTTHIEATSIVTVGVVTPSVSPAPKKRGRPRKVPLEIREELKDPTPSTPPPVCIHQAPPTVKSLPTVKSPSTVKSPPTPSNSRKPGSAEATPLPGGRPKRSCRGQNVMATLGIKPRKPRGGGRGRGGKVNMGDRLPPEPVQMKPEKEPKLTKAKQKLMQKAIEEEVQKQKEEEQTNKQKEEEGELRRKEEEIAKKKEEERQIQEELEKEKKRKEIEEEELKNKREVEDAAIKKKKEEEEARKNKEKEGKEEAPPKKLEITTRAQKAHAEKAELDRGSFSIKTSSDVKEDCVVILDDDAEEVKSDDKREEKEKEDKLAAEEEDKEVTEEAKEDVLVTEEEENEEESEAEREKLALDKQKKLEAIAKCRAKRMEKLAKAAELKEKRREQARQKREAKLAAEEAERIASEKARAARRYGRYGTPKPQISLIDDPPSNFSFISQKSPKQSTAFTAQGIILGETGSLQKGSETIVIDEDSTADLRTPEKSSPLKELEVTITPLTPSYSDSVASTSQSDSTPQKHTQKLLAPPAHEPMTLDTPFVPPTSDDFSLAPPCDPRRPIGTEDVVMVDEETRMSADRGSRAQTPAKQMVPPPENAVEESQGSVHSSGTTESGGGKTGSVRGSKTPRLEVHQETEGIAFSVEQLAEYSWNSQGPFMLQEQVALYLGIKSFKRKYPNIQRRPVDMQERDFIKENGLASEALCDLGLTVVNSQDILDIMYTDFQDKYEEYCKSQREKQARELANKQKALSQITQKPGYEKLDILEQAVQSAAQWNQQFNKARNEQRKASMDLQTFTVHYPKSRTKQLNKPKVAHYPVALVPGQFTDYYTEFTPTEINNLPLNTMCYDEIKVAPPEESDESEDGSDSDSDSSSDSSSSDSSTDEDCKLCAKNGNAAPNGNDSSDGAKKTLVQVKTTATA